ncbi:MAG: Flp pilus assembly complex ATPase component TadA [Bdellovibrionales bacterium]|nr:Flp pilus assembly complex ATPase component TadA [Bdellovibrionales bacterium]
MPVSQNCHVIGVVGGKGGVGKSLFAANFTAAMTLEMKAKTLLIDLDQRSAGDQNVITGLRPQKTIVDLCNSSVPATPQGLAPYISQHKAGFHYLAAVLSPDQRLNASVDLFKKQLFSLSQIYQYIIVDLGNELSDLQMACIEDASTVLMVSTPEVLVVNQTRRMISDLLTATFPKQMFQLVLNKVSKSGLSPQVISQGLGIPVVGMIPQDDMTAFSSLQRSTPFVLSQPNTPISKAYHDVVRKLTGGVLQKLKALSRPKSAKLTQAADQKAIAGSKESSPSAGSDNMSPENLLKMQIHEELIKKMDIQKDIAQSEGDKNKEAELRTKAQKVISELVDIHAKGIARDERSRIIKQITDEAVGLGPLEELLADPNVSEIMVNGFDHIFVEKNGKLQLSSITFTSNLQLRNVITRIVSPLGRQINEKSPYVDGRLKDGSRVNAVIEPLAIDGPALTIRKFAKERITPEHYFKWGSCTKPMMDFLKICVEQGLNVVISGGTGSGKTTLLNVLSGFIPSTERIITVEDAAELQLMQEHVVRLETRPAGTEGTGEIAIRDLIRNSLRMRPDRIVVGECRDGAALDMLQAMNTGHDGSMTTVHANTPKEAISRLETLCLMAGMELPARAIREQIAGAVHLIVQIGRMSDGSRKVKYITEVVGMRDEGIVLQDIFYFKEEGFDKNRRIIGSFRPQGNMPTFIEKFEQRGVSIPRNLFMETAPSNNQQQAAAQQQASNNKPTGNQPTRNIKRPSGLTRNPLKKASGGDES